MKKQKSKIKLSEVLETSGAEMPDPSAKSKAPSEKELRSVFAQKKSKQKDMRKEASKR